MQLDKMVIGAGSGWAGVYGTTFSARVYVGGVSNKKGHALLSDSLRFAAWPRASSAGGLEHGVSQAPVPDERGGPAVYGAPIPAPAGGTHFLYSWNTM